MSQLILPVGDNFSDWTPTPAWSHLDSNDGDYIQGDNTGTTASFSVYMGELQPPQAGACSLSFSWTSEFIGLGSGSFVLNYQLQDASFTDIISGQVVLPIHAGSGTETYNFSADEIKHLVLAASSTLGNDAFFGGDGGGLTFWAQVVAVVSPDVGDGISVTMSYLHLDTPDAFGSYSVSPSCGPKTGGTDITITARGIGLLAADPADLRLQFAGDYNEVTPTVVDDDTITCTTPTNSANTPAEPLPGGWIPLLFAYSVGAGESFSIGLTHLPLAFTDLAWTYTDSCVANLTLSESVAVAALLIGGAASFESDTIGSGGLAIGGQTEFEFFSPSVPTVQNGGQWRLHAFNFKYRQEEIS